MVKANSPANPQASLISRREFIGASAAAAAGASLLLTSCSPDAGKTVAPVKKSALSNINIALIGYGEEGKVLLESLMNIEGVRVVALCDIWDFHRTEGERLLKKSGVDVHAYENFEDLLAKEKDLQAAVVATPDFTHAPITNACLKAGLHVYCEKMMSNTLDAARSMVKTMQETKKLLQIGHQRRSNPRYLFALDRLYRGAKLCGLTTAVQGQWNRAVKEDFGWPKKYEMSKEFLNQHGYENMHQFRNWRWFRALGGGMLSDLGAHQIDIFNWWLGKPARSVMASGGVDYPAYKNHEWYDNAMVIYEYPMTEGDGHLRAFYQVQTTTSAGGGYWEMFMGDLGTIRMSEDPALGALFREPRADPTTWSELVGKNYIHVRRTAEERAKVDVRESAALDEYDISVDFDKRPHQPHLENFFNAIRGTAKLNCPADEAFTSEYIIHKANESIARQQRLVLTPEEMIA